MRCRLCILSNGGVQKKRLQLDSDKNIKNNFNNKDYGTTINRLQITKIKYNIGVYKNNNNDNTALRVGNSATSKR